jgi:FKBP-type peptidyl-prolyl cis-trans isomerase
MVRIVLAALVALSLCACSPSVKFDSADPWATLQPWNHNWAEVEKLPNGVEYIVIRKGDGKGERPGAEDRVEVRYDGRFAKDGIAFDGTGEETTTFVLNEVIPGWTTGLQEMQPGDTFMFWIPWSQAYGEEGRPPEMPSKADLMFIVELVKVMPTAKSDSAAWAKAKPWPTDSSEVIRRPSGLEYFVVRSGPADGASPTDADEVAVHFEGRLEGVKPEEGETAEQVRHRSIVASTYEEGQPKFFPVKDLVPGWSETIKLMRRGDRWMVRMPAQLLYQDEGDGRIPADATVIYELELLDFGSGGRAVPPT